MTIQIDKILSGEAIPSFKVVDYNTKSGKESLCAVRKEQEEIIRRKDVNWQKLNSFVIKSFNV